MTLQRAILTIKRKYKSREAAQFLTDRGFPTSYATLDTMVTRGDGPLYCKWGKYRLYDEDDLLAWAHARTSAKRSSSSEAV